VEKSRSSGSLGAILLAFDPSAVKAEHTERIAELAPGREILVGTDPALVQRWRDRIEIVAGWFAPDRLLDLPNLVWFQQWNAGADWLVDWPQAVEREFVMTSASGVAAGTVTEQAFGYILALTRRLPQALAQQRERVWHKPPPDGFVELAGKTLLVAGLGAIGSRLVHAARAFDLRVIGIRRRPALPAPGVERVGGPDQLAAFLPEADVVVSALPHTRETRHLFSAGAFAQMKEGAIFVSVGRGNVVDEAALVGALASGRLRGAGLDVFEAEPLPADSPLWGSERAIVTPHWGAAFPARFERTMALFLDNLGRFTAGAPLFNLIDKQRGY
jgi:D-2-hydroxyacid dehydrogenase (NADP+)